MTEEGRGGGGSAWLRLPQALPQPALTVISAAAESSLVRPARSAGQCQYCRCAAQPPVCVVAATRADRSGGSARARLSGGNVRNVADELSLCDFSAVKVFFMCAVRVPSIFRIPMKCR